MLADLDRSQAALRRAMSALRAAEEEGDRSHEELARDAICYRLVVIGELSAELPESVKDAGEDVPWDRLTQLRGAVEALTRIESTAVRGLCSEPLAELEYALPEMRASLAK